MKTGVCTKIFHGHFGTINCLDLCGDRLVSGAKDCRVKGKKCINMKTNANSLVVSDGKTSGCVDNSMEPADGEVH